VTTRNEDQRSPASRHRRKAGVPLRYWVKLCPLSPHAQSKSAATFGLKRRLARNAAFLSNACVEHLGVADCELFIAKRIHSSFGARDLVGSVLFFGITSVTRIYAEAISLARRLSCEHSFRPLGARHTLSLFADLDLLFARLTYTSAAFRAVTFILAGFGF
jgi:hypothetical protein